MRYEPETLRDYLVAGVEDPRINVQSVLTRHFLLRHVFPHRFEELMGEEIRFAAALNGLTRLLPALAAPEELEIVLHALSVGSDNAEGIQLPAAAVQSYGMLPASADGVTVPNYLEAALSRAVVALSASRLPASALNTFELLWSDLLAKEPSPANAPGVLEPACGSANDYRCLQSFGLSRWVQYTGFDLCPKNVDNACRLFPEVDFRLGNVFEIDAPDRSFDLCFVHDLFEHLSLEGTLLAARELARVTSRAMCLHFFNMDEVRDHQVHPVEEYHWNLLSMTRMRDLFARLGFEAQVVHIGTFLQMQTGGGETHNPNAYTFLLVRAEQDLAHSAT
jgi:hypothetical protein